jgi:Glyoxalase/Bleomycin resistance protein/Dioxygenase superfamily
VSEWLSCRPNLEVAELGPGIAFLRDVLGFTVDVHEEAMGLALLSRDAVGLALVRTPNPGVNETTAAYLGVTGIDELYGHCQRHHVTMVTPLTDHPWGLRDFVIEIPGGHRLAVGERISGAA